MQLPLAFYKYLAHEKIINEFARFVDISTSL